MAVKVHSDVKIFLDDVLRDFMNDPENGLGSQSLRTTFSRAYTQLVIKDAIMNARTGLNENSIQDGLDWNKKCLEDTFTHVSSLPDEVFDLEDAHKVEVLIKAVEYTKSRLPEAFSADHKPYRPQR